MSQENTDATVNVLSKDELLKIVDDPYFQYLVEKKARAQTRAYLALVGSAILAILAYGGWEFKSAKDQLEKERVSIQSTRKEIQQTADDVKKQKDETSVAVAGLASTVEGAQSLVNHSKEFAEQSNNMTNAMLANSLNSQRSFFEQQGKLLTTVSRINDSAELQLTEVRQQLTNVTQLAAETDAQIKKTQEQAATVLAKAGELSKVGADLVDLTTNAKRLDVIQKRLLQGGIVGTVFMRARQPSTIKMLDPYNPDKREYDWLITFTKFHFNGKMMSVWGEAKRNNAPEVIKFEVVDIDATPSKAEQPFHPLKDYGIPFKIQLNFAYHTLASRDFASLRIFGEESANSPSNNSLSRN